MERIKFVLISPTAPYRRAEARDRASGPRVFRFSMLPSLYVAASMPPYVDTRIVDEDIEPVDFDVDADLVGITCMTYNAPRAYEIAAKFREEKGIPVTYVLYPDEGHGFARPENSLSFFAVTESFLAECLGGRYEPIGDDFEGSSIMVPVGTEEVPGLTEALSQ